MCRICDTLWSIAVFVCAFPIAGCPDSNGPRFLSGPTITANPNPNVPLAAIIDLTTDVPTTTKLVVSDEQKQWKISFRREGTAFSMPLLGLRPAKTHTIEVTIVDKSGNETTAAEKLSFTTDPLPSGFPPIEVKISQPNKMEPGVILFSATYFAASKNGRYLVAVDEAGEVVWYYRSRTSEFSINYLNRFRNGNLACGDFGNSLVEIDMLGNTVQHWYASAKQLDRPEGSIDVNVDSFHHDVIEMPSGNLVAISRESRVFNDYPSNENDPNAPKQTANVVGDVIVEFQRNGSIVNRWSLFDLIDPFRIGFGTFVEIVDWTHANAIVYDEKDDSILVSVRNQDAVIKFSRKTGKPIWILGTHDSWKAPWDSFLLTAKGKLEWPYHSHAPTITPAGTILLFDNGIYRATPPNPSVTSRAVEYFIDESKMEVSEIWKYGGPGDEQFFSEGLGDANWLPSTGNILVTDGTRLLQSANPLEAYWARIVEVTHTTPANKVFEMIIQDKSVPQRLSWTVYRSDKFKDLYPLDTLQ